MWDAVHAPRLHHQLIPMRVEYEEKCPMDVVSGLRDIGHDMYLAPSDIGFASLTAIAREGNKLKAVYDPRRLGSSVVY